VRRCSPRKYLSVSCGRGPARGLGETGPLEALLGQLRGQLDARHTCMTMVRQTRACCVPGSHFTRAGSAPKVHLLGPAKVLTHISASPLLQEHFPALAKAAVQTWLAVQ
jgi:hypothetical protein